MFKEIVDKCLFEVLQKPKRIADCGLELEIEGTCLPGSAPHWQVKSEGSLQEGLEYITKPIKADAVETYVDGLASYIKSYGGEVKPSYRCSTHIHVNMLPEKVCDVLGTYVIFTMFEPVLLSLCGNERNGNLFCMSTYDTGDVVNSFDTLCKAFHRIPTHGYGYSRGKYSAMNLDQLGNFGTLEARCFPLSVEGKIVSEWVNWLLYMRDMAKSQPDKTFRELWKNVRQNPEWYCLKVFGPKAGLHHTNLTELMEIGTETSYELTKVLKNWYSPDKTERSTTRKNKLKFAGSPGLNAGTIQGTTADWTVHDEVQGEF